MSATKTGRKTNGRGAAKKTSTKKVSASRTSNRVRVAEVREALGLNRRLFSRLTGYSERAIADWEGGKELSEASRQRMIEMQRFEEGLKRVMKPEYIGEWLRTPIDAFGGLKPIEVVERGEIDRIWRMVYELESGMPG
jgi:DNA-binding transcriptional regulator YiaG